MCMWSHNLRGLIIELGRTCAWGCQRWSMRGGDQGAVRSRPRFLDFHLVQLLCKLCILVYLTRRCRCSRRRGYRRWKLCYLSLAAIIRLHVCNRGEDILSRGRRVVRIRLRKAFVGEEWRRHWNVICMRLLWIADVRRVLRRWRSRFLHHYEY